MNTAIQLLANDLVSEQPKFFTKASQHKELLINGFRKGKQPGESTHIIILDENLTIRPGFLYAFTGWPGSGKSEFLTQIVERQAVKKDRRTALYSPESYPVDEFIDSIIHCYLGKTTDKRFPGVCSEEEYLQAIDWVDEHFYFLEWEETPDPETVLEAFKFLHEVHKVMFFVVDPFNSLITEGESSNIAVALKKNLTSFKRFASQRKVCVFLVEHPKTPSDPKEYDNIPGPRQMFGGTMWWNKTDILLSVHRPNRDDPKNDEVIIKVWKVKNQHLNGRPGEKILHYDFKTRRYIVNDAKQINFYENEKDPF